MNKNQILVFIKNGFQKMSDFIEKDETQSQIDRVKEGISKAKNSQFIEESKSFAIELFRSEEVANFKKSFIEIFKKKER